MTDNMAKALRFEKMYQEKQALATGCTCGRGDLDVDPNCPLHHPKATPVQEQAANICLCGAPIPAGQVVCGECPCGESEDAR